MRAPGWTITLVLLCLFGSATSSPVASHTSAPPISSQLTPPATPSSLLSSTTPSTGIPEEMQKSSFCPLKISPSTLVVRFGDPVAVNCSIEMTGFPMLGWEQIQPTPDYIPSNFLVWRVEQMTEWTINPICFALVEEKGPCSISLPVIVYEPPESVTIRLVNHSGAMLEGHHYILECEVQNVAPIENLTVTFYKGQTALSQLHSNSHKVRTPVTETFTLDITVSKEDNGAQFWCEAKLELGPEGPQPPPVVMSKKLSAIVHFGPQLVCSTKLQVREGESVKCEVAGNPPPSVTWFKDGLRVTMPTHSSRKHTGKYTICAEGLIAQRNFTVEVEVLAASGTTNSWTGHILAVTLLTQVINWE
ncbi:vascular cell adhesion protein 1-like isoform X2 [Mugil cephalus]|uniref:vascular cell adhesion protein 1-like isoform X2 n=1 Tax=Mugil cephalus TaxID=48193 RepID=UPI001FB73D0A|nr:vascular cell adhesion protein 1-like isoform X2 [Mugil cephalus]